MHFHTPDPGNAGGGTTKAACFAPLQTLSTIYFLIDVYECTGMGAAMLATN
jgi:hypothetical protein